MSFKQNGIIFVIVYVGLLTVCILVIKLQLMEDALLILLSKVMHVNKLSSSSIKLCTTIIMDIDSSDSYFFSPLSFSSLTLVLFLS